jgi:hypothetical protein
MVQTRPRVPTFLLLGAAKCGTTSLAYYLSQHPSVFFSEPKEPTFFEAEWERGLDHYWRTYFAGWSGEPAIGEGRVWNLYLPFVPVRIREALPDAKLLVLLRDPVDRAHSHWWHRHSQGQETLDFARAIEEDRARIERGEAFAGEEGARRWRAGLEGGGHSTRHRALLDLGFYAEQIERYLTLYPATQLKVVFHEDLAADLPGVMRELFAFVGVDPDLPLRDAEPQNVRRDRVRSPAARRAEFASRSLGLRHLIPRGLRPRLRSWLFERRGRRPALDPGLRRELRAYYDPHTARLERLTGRDLSLWRERCAE